MTKYDIKFVPVAPKTYTIKYVENQNKEIKKSPLSVVARSKIVNRDQVYQSQNQEGYGPCLPTSKCICKSEELRRQADELLQLAEKRKKEEEVSFYLAVDVINSSGRGFLGVGHCTVYLNSIAEAERFINQVNSGNWQVSMGKWSSHVAGPAWITSGKRQRIVDEVQYYIDCAEAGNSVNKTISDSDIQGW